MQGPLFTLATAWLFLVGSQVQETQALRMLEVSSEYPSDCQGTGGTFIDFSLGAHGGDALDSWFRDNQVFDLFYQTAEEEKIGSLIRQDLLQGKDHLPQLQKLVTESRAKNRCGHVFIGDIKPNLIVGGSKDPFAIKNESSLAVGGEFVVADVTYDKLFTTLDKVFPDATFIWLLRHPDKYADSMSRWKDSFHEQDNNEFLRKARESHANFHCAAYQYFGNKVTGKYWRKAHGKGGVVQLNLEQVKFKSTSLEWTRFVKDLRETSGNQALSSEGGMPQSGKGTQPSSWFYNPPDTSDWHPGEFLKNTCPSSDASKQSLKNTAFDFTPWDAERDSGI